MNAPFRKLEIDVDHQPLLLNNLVEETPKTSTFTVKKQAALTEQEISALFEEIKLKIETVED